MKIHYKLNCKGLIKGAIEFHISELLVRVVAPIAMVILSQQSALTLAAETTATTTPEAVTIIRGLISELITITYTKQIFTVFEMPNNITKRNRKVDM
jgi:hypothetical protein